MLHRFALAPGDHVNGKDSSGQSNLVVAGRIHAVLLAHVLLVFRHELDVFAARILLIKNYADEIDALRSRVLEQHIKTQMSLPLVGSADAVPTVIDALADPDLATARG